MIDAYLNMRYAGNHWFDDLMISDLRPEDPKKNHYPVLYLDLKSMDTSSLDAFINDFRLQVSRLCKTHPELAMSDRLDDDSRSIFDDLLRRRSDSTALRRSLLLLTEMLHTHYGRKAIVLIDEYDDPVNRAYGKSQQREIMDCVRDIMSSCMKGNQSLEFAVVTGVLQIAKESIFSGLNNIKVNNILSTDMDEMFGFTPAEVERLCSDYGHPERFEEARDWYDGYRFGNAEIYNPWSILSYVDSGFSPNTYWAGTSGNSIIDTLLSQTDADTDSQILSLSEGNSIESRMDPEVTFSDISGGSDRVYSIMAMSGYLRVVSDGRYGTFSIPNREMFDVFASRIAERSRDTGRKRPPCSTA